MKELRMATGLSQGDLAKLIGVSQSMIARCESNKRNLATKYNLRYLELYNAWLQLQKKPKNPSKNFSAEFNKQHDKVRERLLKEIKEQEYEVERLNRLLQYQQEHFKKMKELSKMAEVWQVVATDKGAGIWLSYLALHSTSELKHCAPAQQKLTLMRIKNAKALLQHAREALRDLKK